MVRTVFIPSSFADVVCAINRWNESRDLKLTYHGQQEGAAVWGASNCLIIAHRVSDTRTEVRLSPYKETVPDDHAATSWNQLGSVLAEAYQIAFEPLLHPDLFFARITEWSIESCILNPDTNPLDEMSWKAHREEELAESAAHLYEEMRRLSGIDPEMTLEAFQDRYVHQRWNEWDEWLETEKEQVQRREAAAHKTTAAAAAEYFMQRRLDAATADTEAAQPEQAEGGTTLLHPVNQDSGHYNHDKKRRQEIVKHYRRDRSRIPNKNLWAKTKYQICGRTLLNYEREFPEET